ncbi:MAG: methyl-accepting chemotaxis protein, partial [Chelatococcus sp.]
MLKHASIVKKFAGVVAAMSAVAIVIAICGWWGLTQLKRSMLDIEQTGQVTQEAMDLRIDIIALSRMTYQLALQPEKHAEFAAETEKRVKEMLARLPVLEAGADEEEKRLLGEVSVRLESYFGQIRSMVSTARTANGNRVAIELALAMCLEGQRTVTDAVKAYTTASGKAIAETRADAFAAVDRYQFLQLAVAAIGIVGGLLLGFVIAREGVLRPLQRLNAAMRGIAEGDLDSEIGGADRRDEIGQMAGSLQTLRESLLRARELEASERSAAAARLERARSMEAVVTDVGEVVSAAAAGDFSARLRIDTSDEQMQKLVAGINE